MADPKDLPPGAVTFDCKRCKVEVVSLNHPPNSQYDYCSTCLFILSFDDEKIRADLDRMLGTRH